MEVDCNKIGGVMLEGENMRFISWYLDIYNRYINMPVKGYHFTTGKIFCYCW
ncbi:hypothetical protein SCFA_3250002 [anaerobic digester metagenome]|uniref:Uncharacterized protein n=1 Tax=anaerobic digester metagenome TaxID=1263854 RepID=A0A485M2U4_9ZZZZ